MSTTTDGGPPPGPPGGDGRFVVIEGIEGAGKTTQVARLCRRLRARGVRCREGREPGGTPVGEAIRSLLLAEGKGGMPPETELLLILAARAAFVREFLRPVLARGEVVVSDRFELSTLAYQGYGRGLEIDRLRALNAFATGGLRPDLTVVLDVAVEEGLRRGAAAGKVPDRIEGSGRDFLERVRAGYVELSRTEPGVVVVDGRGTPEEVEARVVEVLEERFPETFGNAEG